MHPAPTKPGVLPGGHRADQRRPDLDYSWRTVAGFLNQFDRQVATNVAFLYPTARSG